MPTVLVVEDEANVRKLVVVNLASRGYTVLEARDAQQALEHLRQTRPDLMVLDIKMPDLTGWDLLAMMASDTVMNMSFPVLVMTASLMDAHAERDKYPNVVGVLIKPFSATHLVHAVERALRTTLTR